MNKLLQCKRRGSNILTWLFFTEIFHWTWPQLSLRPDVSCKFREFNILRNLPAFSDRLKPTASACVSFTQLRLLCGDAYYPHVVWQWLRLPPSLCTMTPFRTFCSYWSEGTSQMHLILRFLKALDEVKYHPPLFFLSLLSCPSPISCALTDAFPGGLQDPSGSGMPRRKVNSLQSAELLGSPAPHFLQWIFWSVN